MFTVNPELRRVEITDTDTHVGQKKFSVALVTWTLWTSLTSLTLT